MTFTDVPGARFESQRKRQNEVYKYGLIKSLFLVDISQTISTFKDKKHH